MDQELQNKLTEWRAAVRKHLSNPSFSKEPIYLSEPMNYALKAEGKMLRPALCLAATEAVGGDWREAVIVAAALEIFHTFSLVHDDIMDDDVMRRGVPTLHAAFNRNRALLSGDTLLIYVYQLLSAIDSAKFPEIFRAFNEGAMDVCKGQGWDMEFEQRQDVEPDEYVKMIDLKTGALIKLACELGGILGGGSGKTIKALARFGLLLGRAFQMQDDLLEVTSSATAMGKSLGSDLLKEKKTWIWLDLKKNLSSAESLAWEKIRMAGQLDETHRDQIKSWMSGHGTIRRAQDLIQSWVAEADELLNSTSFKNPEMLKALTDVILNRVN